VKPFELLGQTLSPDGSVMKLVRRGDDYLILADNAVLMSSRAHGSEQDLATLACQRARTLKQPTVLIGGLGMGFTLRAALDLLPPGATVVVAELVPAVIEWNQGLLGSLAAHPLKDRRVRIEMTDVAATLGASRAQFDAILLDVDNGPAAFTTPTNAALYDNNGITGAHAALKKEGILAIWSVKSDHQFEQRSRAAGFKVQVHDVRGRQKMRGPRYTVSLCQKP
jgi:spermidine synthase